ncbi:phosphoribosylamine--glycine ligase [Parasphaerochaeta coccoides]|uniref:Phosphoribosylglycinamide formyltransferase n=1 Tax=Parasphaerochaeta coccoides (strain ATCC BAA-1237 / DSM 17374 / SPN1) TaxID=760011 RepID=F4GHX4_PARC1|nr:phosphoribosylamine--glycine ligase [Parasphaerochaeta coccoides]AEC02087.1 Phosphoribosylamine--glycine ligase [Parasphaerochaeta coccoides DSM 17374]
MELHNIIVVGSGAREHAIALAIYRSLEKKRNGKLHCFGSTYNPGIGRLCSAIGGSYAAGVITDGQAVLSFARSIEATMAVIGPEAPLETRVADVLRRAGIPTFGPGASCARIETSKSFAREFLSVRLPQHSPRHYVVSSLDEARAAMEELDGFFVVKADGLAGGKGVKVSQEHLHGIDEALDFCAQLLKNSGRPFVIEEKLYGEEFSLMSITDGETCYHLPAIQDHKRAYDGDTGPNTGGMGSYSCADGSLPFLSPDDIAHARACNEVVMTQLGEVCGEPYRGVLYGGFMAVSDGVKIIEYNARFGDPEALNLLTLLQSDAVELFHAAATGRLKNIAPPVFAPLSSVCLYAVPSLYPIASEKGRTISIGDMDDDVTLFLGSIDETSDGSLVTAGSRTAAVTALAPHLQDAREKAIYNLGKIEGPLRHRSDIGTEALLEKRIRHMNLLRRPIRLGILGSTRGTDLKALYSFIEDGSLNAEVTVVVSDKKNSGILELARSHGTPAHAVSAKGLTRQEHEKAISLIMEEAGADIIILIGYMRIVTRCFCESWKDRLLNVHPSLLPDFAGGMDTDVHEEVLRRYQRTGNDQTGCTVHLVTPAVDGGPIVLQKKYSIKPSDTPTTLKAAIQKLEGEALKEAITYFHRTGGSDWDGAQHTGINR